MALEIGERYQHYVYGGGNFVHSPDEGIRIRGDHTVKAVRIMERSFPDNMGGEPIGWHLALMGKKGLETFLSNVLYESPQQALAGLFDVKPLD